MPYNLQNRFSASGTQTASGNRTQTIILARDVVDLNVIMREGTGETFQQVLIEQTLAPSANYDFSLRDAANPITDIGGVPLQLQSLRWFVMALVNPVPAASLRFGPQATTNPCPLWFSGVGSSAYETLTDSIVKPIRGGLSIAAGAASLRVNNPSAIDVSFRIWVAGLKA